MARNDKLVLATYLLNQYYMPSEALYLQSCLLLTEGADISEKETEDTVDQSLAVTKSPGVQHQACFLSKGATN